MRRPRFVWQIFGSYLLVLLPALLAVTAWLYRDAQRSELGQVRARLRDRADLVAAVLARPGAPRSRVALGALLRQLGRPGSVRITLMDRNGTVVADTALPAHALGNLRDRPEVRAALAGRTGKTSRRSTTLGREMLYYAAPYARQGLTLIVVRTAIALGSVQSRLSGVLARVALAWLVVALLGAIASLALAHRLARPLVEMQSGARRFAEGDLRYRLPVARTAELGSLADAMNRMAEQMDARIRTVTQQRNQLEAVLTSMVEAVIVADPRGRILRINRAAGALLGLDADAVAGASVETALGQPDLVAVFHRLLQEVPSVEAELELVGQDRRTLRAIGTQLRDARGERLGAMVVLHDVTQLKRLESIRRDFVANVSHELRTPITSIQGYVETLRDGALSEPEYAERFLEIIDRQSARLSAIVDDLLCLSHIEMQGGAGQIDRELVSVWDLLGSSLVPMCERAEAQGGTLMLSGDEGLRAEVNAPLLEQAVGNLVDNALKYAGPKAHVEVSVRADGPDIVVTVSDNGPGIPPEHQARIFERFYRVDKARSRAVGGTGLGLAIVKHIAVAHGGQVTLSTRPGQGCRFELRIPRLTET